MTKKAWVENGRIRDVVDGDPAALFHPTVAVHYDTDVPDEVKNGWLLTEGVWAAPPSPDLVDVPLADRPLEERRLSVLDQIRAKVAGLLAAGAPVDHNGATLHIDLNDGPRADLTAMAATALGALSSAVSWPASYQTGWITKENTRVPLSTPAEGLALAAGVGDYYAQIVQLGRDLKDAVIAAADDAALDLIDIEAGWP